VRRTDSFRTMLVKKRLAINRALAAHRFFLNTLLGRLQLDLRARSDAI
jgi:hypothetical protein